VKIMQHGLGSLRGAIGTPDQVIDLCRRYEAAGVDQVIFVLQAGPNRHEHICESLEQFGRQVLPHFGDRREEREREKAERLAGAVERALARRSPPREAPSGYLIDEQAELARATPSLGAAGLRARLRTTGQEALARLVRGKSDPQLERRFGADRVQRLIFQAMARQFEPRFAFGFEGDIAYVLTHHANRSPAHPAEPAASGRARPASRWTVRVENGGARVLPGVNASPAITFTLSVPDWARLIAEEADPQELLFTGRFDVQGDLALATRVPEMFGAAPRF
jgi:hypothetical protein